MKITILQEELIKSLTAVSRIVGSRGQMPVLSNILIEAIDTGVIITVTNLELTMRVLVGGKVEETGALTVPVRALTEFVGTLQPGPIVLISQEEKLNVVSSKFKASFAGIGAAEFPEIAKLDNKQELLVFKKEIFVTAATKVAFSAATDESRPVLTGIKFQFTKSNLQITATDGFRLSRQTIDSDGEMQVLVIPAKTILELAKIGSEGRKEDIEMQIVKESNQVVFAYDKYQLVSRLLEGNFPDVDKIIPTEFKTTSIMDRQELMRAVRAVGVFAREANNIIKFQITNSKIQISAVGGQTGGSEVEVDADVNGEETEISFNFRYILDYLNSVDYERVALLTNGPLEKGVWRGEKNEAHTHLIMPVRI